MNTALPNVFDFQINVGRQFAFEGETLVQDARGLQGIQIGGKRRENRAADRKTVLVEELIPVVAKSGFKKDTLGEEPAILTVSAEFSVVLGEGRGTREDRVARAGRGPVEKTLSDSNAVTRSWEGLAFAQVRDRSSEVVCVVAE